jgi:hypothetical protein
LNGDDDMLCISDHPHLTEKTSELRLRPKENALFENIWLVKIDHFVKKCAGGERGIWLFPEIALTKS